MLPLQDRGRRQQSTAPALVSDHGPPRSSTPSHNSGCCSCVAGYERRGENPRNGLRGCGIKRKEKIKRQNVCPIHLPHTPRPTVISIDLLPRGTFVRRRGRTSPSYSPAGRSPHSAGPAAQSSSVDSSPIVAKATKLFCCSRSRQPRASSAARPSNACPLKACSVLRGSGFGPRLRARVIARSSGSG